MLVLALVLGGTPGTAVAGSKAKVFCWNNNFPPPGPNSGRPDIRSTPKKCSLYRDGYNIEIAGALHMRKLHWKHWGDKTTVAKGEYGTMDIDDPWKPIRVRLKRPTEDCGRTVYSRVTFHAHIPGASRHDSFPIWTC